MVRKAAAAILWIGEVLAPKDRALVNGARIIFGLQLDFVSLHKKDFLRTYSEIRLGL